jgi:uncharacterized protein
MFLPADPRFSSGFSIASRFDGTFARPGVVYNAAAGSFSGASLLNGSASMNVLLQLLVGAIVGILVGITGTGGAFVIPALIYLFRMDQLRAQGTALMISSLPIWFIAFIPYARSHHFDLRLGLLIALGICVGSYFGASWAQHLPLPVLRRVLGSVLILIGARFLYQG